MSFFPRYRWLKIFLGAVVLFLLAVPTGLFWAMARPALHKDIINKYAAIYKFDPLFVMALVKVESSFVQSARSPVGAVGLMQLMPDTALEMARRSGRTGVKLNNIAEPEINIHLGCHYLSVLRDEFKDDTTAILAAYNGGPTNVRLWRKPGKYLRSEDIPFTETRLFVVRVMRTFRWLKRFQRFKHVFAI